jgi:hypothetical protein
MVVNKGWNFITNITYSLLLLDDSCVDHHEYTTAHHPVSAEVADKMFYHFDHNNDNCLTVDDMKAEYPLIDHNRKFFHMFQVN